MSNVIKLPAPAYKGTQPRVKTFPDTPGYFCTRCQGEDFKLYENGAIHCSGCRSLIRNIVAVKK